MQVEASNYLKLQWLPVMIEYEADGKRYQEMHVDGGVTRQVFLFPGALRLQQLLMELGLTGRQHLYIILNGSLEQRREVIKANIFAISARSIETLIKNQAVGDLYRLYLFAQKNDITYHLTFIPPDFSEEPDEMFDREYMRSLFDLGFQKGLKPDHWQRKPPEFESSNVVDIH